MKKYIVLLICAAGLLFASCSQDRLDIPQKGVIPMESFYITDEDAESAATAMYARLLVQLGTVSVRGTMIYTPWVFTFNLPGDDLYAACKEYGNNDFEAAVNEFRYDASNDIISSCYRNLYLANHRCNLITDHFQYGESAIKDRVISEARVLRAWIHMTLAIGWNNPPLVDHVLEGADKPGNYEGGQKGLLEWCAKECEEAAPYMRKRNGAADAEAAVVATQGFAYAVAGKSHMFAGNYDQALTDLKKVIDSGSYSLVPGEEYEHLFHIEGDGAAEKIFELSVVENANVSNGTQRFRSIWQAANMWCWRGDRFAGLPTEVGMRFNGWGGLGVGYDFAEKFIAHDGDSYRRKATMVSYEEVLTELHYANDIKADGTEMTYEEKMHDATRGLKDIRGLYGNCEYLQKKRLTSAEDVAGHSIWPAQNFLIMRYAEVLLMYAECCVQTGKEMDKGLQVIRQIQERAGIPAENYATQLTLDVVKNEKMFELWCEGCRFADCVRWGDTAGMEAAGGLIPTLYDHINDTDASTKTDYHSPYLVFRNYNQETGKRAGFQKGKHEFFPFPDLETSINPNIVQNPGW
ncbi:MAG: RagB/SusD family nutrient uptake outer membrane protein [Bacteroidales bacterium]|nr:RagB/SusD family nutrient uptake outer membrane protein [Bacteroidales bacterium]